MICPSLNAQCIRSCVHMHSHTDSRLQARMKVKGGKVEADLREEKLRSQEKEEKKLGEMMIPKKRQFLYKRIVSNQKQKTKEVSSD